MSVLRVIVVSTFLICYSATPAAGALVHDVATHDLLLPERGEPLFATEVSQSVLLDVDPSSALVTPLCYLPTPVAASLAYDESSGMLYATDAASRNLLVIDPVVGATTVVGSMGLELPHAAAIDPSNGNLYVVSTVISPPNAPSFLYAVNKLTGTPHLVGAIGYDQISGLDFDPTTGILYGARGGPDDVGVLITIDTSTGQGTLVCDTRRMTAISFDSSGQMYGIDNGPAGGLSSLYLIDKSNGSSSFVGTMGVDNVLGLVFGGSATPVEARSWAGIKAMFR